MSGRVIGAVVFEGAEQSAEDVIQQQRTGATAPEAFRFYRPRCDRVVAQVLAEIAGQRA